MSEIIRRVEDEEQPAFRPEVRNLRFDVDIDNDPCDGVVDLMVLCWEEYPLLRPPFSIICPNLRRIRQAYGT